MSTKSSSSLLQKPLYVFDLPSELLHTLQLRTDLNLANLNAHDAIQVAAVASSKNQRLDSQENPQDGRQNAMSCALCALSFPSLQQQREHVRSDLHGYNLKQKLRGLPSVSDKEFEKLVDELDESISGSESSYTDSSDDQKENHDSHSKGTTLSALLKKQANLTAGDEDDDKPRKRKRGAGKPPLLWFTSPKIEHNVSLGIYRTLFSADEQVADGTVLLDTLQRKQRPARVNGPPKAGSNGDDTAPAAAMNDPHYFLCMIGGGHFAAMAVSLTPTIVRKSGIEDRAVNVLAHKTFHRYTTRRKQGGSQSANDNSKGNAHSAGAGLRRYNEAALVSDVRNLLAEWKPLIQSSELLFIRATGTTNRRTLFGPYDGQVMTSNDPRIRGFPFSTRRPTQAELMRSFVELTRVKVSTEDELAQARAEAEAAAKADSDQAAPKAQAPSKPAKPKISKEEEEALLHTSQIQALIRRSKAPALVSYLTTNKLEASFAFVPADKPENHHAPTPLHLAASLNSSACVSALLLRASADPTTRNAEGKTAYDIAGDRATRDAFRLARSELGEARFAWNGAGVGSALSKAEAESRAAAERSEADAEKVREAQRRQAELDRIRAEEKAKEESGREKKFGKGKAVGLRPELTAQEKREQETRGMTPEMRMRLERERRARAAEARMKK